MLPKYHFRAVKTEDEELNGTASVANENFLLTFPQGLSAEGSDAPGDEVKHKSPLQSWLIELN